MTASTIWWDFALEELKRVRIDPFSHPPHPYHLHILRQILNALTCAQAVLGRSFCLLAGFCCAGFRHCAPAFSGCGGGAAL